MSAPNAPIPDYEAPSPTRCGARWFNERSRVQHVCYAKPHDAATPHVCGRKKGTSLMLCRVKWIETDRGTECLTRMDGYLRQPQGRVVGQEVSA